MKELHTLLVSSQAAVNVANDRRQAAVDRADEMQIHSLNCTRELEHAQGAIVDLEVVVKEQKFTIMANEQKQFELL